MIVAIRDEKLYYDFAWSVSWQRSSQFSTRFFLKSDLNAFLRPNDNKMKKTVSSTFYCFQSSIRYISVYCSILKKLTSRWRNPTALIHVHIDCSIFPHNLILQGAQNNVSNLDVQLLKTLAFL